MMVKVIVGSGLMVSRFRKFAGYVDEEGMVRMGGTCLGKVFTC